MGVLLTLFGAGLVLWLAGAGFGIVWALAVGITVCVSEVGLLLILWLHGVGRETRR